MPHLLPLPAGWSPISEVGPSPSHLFTTAASLRLGQFLSRRFLSRRFLFRSPHQWWIDMHFSKLKDRSSALFSMQGAFLDVCNGWAFKLKGLNFITWSNNVLSATCSAFFFENKQTGQETRNGGISSLEEKSRRSSYQRIWTNVLLAANVVLYVAQITTQGKLMLWGAKINSLIDQGQLWRLVTSSFLHANIAHLMINCYSLNSIGPAVETISGPRRFIAIYFTSAIASTAMSYWMCKAPAVGASGAIFGLVGSVAVFVMRHKGLVGRGTEDLQQIAHVIVLNMVMGLVSRGIDNWGHLGGLLGGAAISWLLGPAWKLETASKEGRRVFADRAPISYILGTKSRPR